MLGILVGINGKKMKILAYFPGHLTVQVREKHASHGPEAKQQVAYLPPSPLHISMYKATGTQTLFILPGKRKRNLRKLLRNGNLKQIITDVCVALADVWHKNRGKAELLFTF